MPSAKKPRVLVVDDEEVMQDVLQSLLQGDGAEVTQAADAERGLAALAQSEFDLVLLDLMLPGMSGMDALTRIHKTDPDLPVVMVTAFATVENAIEAMKRGAADYVVKPFRNDELLLVVRRGVAARRMQLENRALRRELRDRYRFERIVGRSEKMQRVFDVLNQAAPSRSTILVEGESGTGKELVARAIHVASPRAEAPFVVASCGNLVLEHQASALFGAVQAGLFEAADGGSLFLDEVASLSADVQAKLVRALQEREVIRAGGHEPRKVDVRIIAATNSDLVRDVEKGTFREDLFYRLNVISIRLPPLRDRTGDVPLLAAHFLQQYAHENDKKVRAISPRAMSMLEGYHWPGNVRELENVIQKAVVLARGDEITPELIADDVRAGRGPARPRPVSAGVRYKDLVEEFERDVILGAMKEAQGVQKKAALLLGVKATTLNEKIKRLRIRYRA